MPTPHETLRAHRLFVDTHDQPVVYMRADCSICRSEGFQARSRVRIDGPRASVVAVLNTVRDGFVGEGEAGLSEAAWRHLDAREGDLLRFAHPEPVRSMSHVRARIYSHPFTAASIHEVIADIAAGRYSDIELAAFITACGGDRLGPDEIVGLTRAMIDVGTRLDWGRTPIVDKHCVGGLPGNRTTLVVVPIVAALGLTMPKTSSRAITSPAGTADTMEVLAPVELSLAQLRRVVDREGGCVASGTAVGLSPADDVLIRVERALDIDSGGQLVASVLSKKAAAGSTHVVIDLPVGPTAKVRSREAGQDLARLLEMVGEHIGVKVRALVSDGSQPVGDGIGPALEARDVVRVLRGAPDAPADLRERSLVLAGEVLGLAGAGDRAMAEACLADGRAWRKFMAIAAAQGGLREIPAPGVHARPVLALHAGTVDRIDNRDLARVAKLAGAPDARAAGVDLHVRLGTRVEPGQPLFTIHAETPGELAYALQFAETRPDVVQVQE